MRKAPIDLQELQRRISLKAKSERSWRFWGLYVHVCKPEVLAQAYRLSKVNHGAAGIDGKTFEQIEEAGLESFLEGIRAELIARTYEPERNRRVEIPKSNGKVRVLGIPTVKDRVVQGALKLVLEPIFEADFQECSYGYRPGRSPHQAVRQVERHLLRGHVKVLDVDLTGYFDNVRHHLLLEKIAQRVQDPEVLHLVKLILKANGEKGVPQGGVISPLFSNLYLNEVDRMFEKAKEVTGGAIQFVRFADDMVVLIHRDQSRWMEAVQRRLTEELDRLEVTMNREKTKVVDLDKGESFGFLGFDFRLKVSRKGRQYPLLTPQKKKQIDLLRRVTWTLRRNREKTVQRVVKLLNPILRGWVNYFRVGNSGRAFNLIKEEVEKKVRRFVRKNQHRPGFGWKAWSPEAIYAEWGLFNDYQIRYFRAASPSR
jgi:RNA-directed DNA polymerase